MFADFWYMHADVIRNAIVLVLWVAAGVFITVLITRWVYRKKAFREANEHLLQECIELRIKNTELRAVLKEHLGTIERLTIVQGAAVGMARTVQAVVGEKP